MSTATATDTVAAAATAAAPVAGRKRPRPSSAATTSGDIFLDLKRWILAQRPPPPAHPAAAAAADDDNDGTATSTSGAFFFVHPHVDMRTEDRSLVVVGGAIAKGATVFTLPAVQAPPKPSSSSDHHHRQHDDDDGGEVDAELAWYLARRPSELEPYLNSLPETMDDALPRCWSSDRLDRLLRGSPVLARIRQQREALQEDYRRLVVAAAATAGKQQQTKNRIPSLEEFNYAMAAVTSRAFCCNHQDGNNNNNNNNNNASSSVVMVPLLDLCNHHRGTTDNGQKKNLSYTVVQSSSAPPSAAAAAAAVVVVHVRAATDLAAGERLRITYGARGNGPLLLNYGFCLPPHCNLEPDGSSNDALEFAVVRDSGSGSGSTSSADTVFLRTGPKAYTYGSFVKALEFFWPRQPQQQNTSCGVAGRDDDIKASDSAPDGDDGDNDDMDAFLNECDAEEENYNDDDKEEEKEEEEEGGLFLEAEKKTDEERKAIELGALVCFRASLLERARAYNLQQDDIENILERGEINSTTPEYNAALLIKSELRIIQFYLLAIDGLEKKLGRKQTEESVVVLVHLEPSDSALIEKQVEELVAAYMQIRHSDFLDGVSQS